MGFEPQTESKSVYQGRLAVSGVDAGKQVFNGFSVGRKIMCLGLAAVSSLSPHRNHVIFICTKFSSFFSTNTRAASERKCHFGPLEVVRS